MSSRDATGLSRSYVQKLISDGRLTADGLALKSNAIVAARVRAPARRAAGRDARDRPAPEIPVHVVYEDDDLLIVDKPSGLVVHPSPGHAADTLVNALLARGRRVRVRRHRRRRAAGDRPPPRSRHQRAPDGRQGRRRPGVADGTAEGAPDQEDVPGAGPRLGLGGRRPHRGADRPRPEAPYPDGGRDRWAAVGRPATASASGSTAGRSSSSTSSPAGPTRSASTSTPSATRSPATRSTAARSRAAGPTAWAAVPARLAARAGRPVRRPPHPRDRAAPRRAGGGCWSPPPRPDGARPLTVDPTSSTRARADRGRRGCARRPAGDHLGPERRGEGHDHRGPARRGRATRTTTTS